MTPGDMTDPMFRMLAQLPAIVPSAAREDRVRTRCHAALAQCQRRRTNLRDNLPVALLSRGAFAVGVCLYFLATVREAWRLIHFP